MIQAKLPAKAIEAPRISYRFRSQAIAYLFLAPAVLIFALTSWYPLVLTIINSFQFVKLTGGSTWVGTQNYVRMFGDPLFLKAWENTAVFVFLSIVMGFMVPVVLALMLNEMRGLIAGLVRSFVYMPALIPIAIALLVWRQIYAPEGGMLNSLLGLVGIEAQLWLQSISLAKPSIIIITTWLGMGGTILIYLAALQEIPTEIYEASEIDGFSILQRIWYITLPLIRSRMQVLLILQIIMVSQIFNEPFILTSGGPASATVTPVLQIYNIAFNRTDYGLAAAWSVSMLVVVGLISIVYVWLSQRRQSDLY